MGTGPKRQLKQRGRCTGCGRRMRSTPGQFVCAACRGHRPSEAQALEAEAYCEWCGRRHADRQVCRDKAERSSVAVRLWLAGMQREECEDVSGDEG